VLIVFAVLVMTVFSIFITGSERRIPVQYAKRVVGRKMYGGQSTNLPIKLNMSGVMPVIFASSIISLPATIMTLCGVTEASKGFWGGLYRFLSPNGWFYPVMLFVLIIAFAYFYITISFNPVEVSSNLKKNGGEYAGGSIYDPGNGKTYNCSMKVEGDVLKVRGSLDKRGLLGRTMDWFRVK
jgi:preprotein translocase subunit SecY